MYYKVVRRISDYSGDESKDRLRSVVTEDERFRCEYKQGEKTVPKIGLLFVFTDYQAALDWQYKMRSESLEIWRVAVEEPIRCPVFIPNLLWSTVEEVWCGDEFVEDGDLSWAAPETTVLAKSVTFLAKVE
jgi:hypothetical protein